jgi:hypothetical protein
MGRVPGLKPKKSQGPFYASRCILARPARSFPGGYYAETRANEELVRSLQRLTERLALSSPEAMQRAEDLVYSVEMEDRSGDEATDAVTEHTGEPRRSWLRRWFFGE